MGYRLMTRKNTECDINCCICGNPAGYWSQKENEDGWTADGLSFSHCQAHRGDARALAEKSTREDVEKRRRKILKEKESQAR